ncbi:AMP-binding protein [Sphingopyxis sp. FBM22]|nr:AMP-binding protein [Sphingopyxis yananensis]MCC2603110.1 AMP-binding protein [Sphingopyxis yananensis]
MTNSTSRPPATTETPTRPELRREHHFGRETPCFANRPSSLAASLRRAASSAADAEAFVEGERRITYRMLLGSAERVAAALAGMGVGSGDRVAILLRNRVEFPIIFYACSILGAIAVPMNLRQSADETLFALNQSGARILFHESDARLPESTATPKLGLRIEITDRGGLPEAAMRTFAPVDEKATAAILYTSGTTGRPKGAVLTHFSIIHSVQHYRYHYDLRYGERSLLAVPASHVTGLVALIAVSVDLAGCLILMREFKAETFLELAASEAIGYTLMVPAMYILAMMSPAFDPSRLDAWRVGGFGGAPMPASTVAELSGLLPNLRLHNTYGATETSSPAVIMPSEEAALHNHAIGRPVLCADIRVVGEDGTPVPAGETGEIWIAGPMVIPGYWNDNAATTASFSGGFWKSGDIGSIDAAGYLTLHDRKKDMISRGGFKIYSVEVENILAADPQVIEAAVVGHPCPILGERVKAFVYAVGADTALEEDLRMSCATLLSDYKVPERIFVEHVPLPRNANGKILKAELRERLANPSTLSRDIT